MICSNFVVLIKTNQNFVY